ncbi:hypothetical protein KZO25_16200 [Halomonas sp. ANAO-440]|uniref:hypothetical protein n=1 Tax=Halomonas sp. ANAO-440 TaxID=2861360 RepID=UPI001CAA4774|nr:hypothetical protein [Halomonas sp. ANAO-440]MBZ0331860.1 hypothetical protein [Halomonas sp. ANAO-440]
MKRINYSQQGIEIELVLTRDPFNCEWLAVARWEASPGAIASLHSMPALRATASEADAWDTAKEWANRLVREEWLNSTGFAAATSSGTHAGYDMRSTHLP